MHAEPSYERASTVGDAENWLALGTGALLLLVGVSRRSTVGACVAVSSVPLLYRGITGRWPLVLNGYGRADDSRTALTGSAGIHVREAIRLEVPLEEAYDDVRFSAVHPRHSLLAQVDADPRSSRSGR
jgi:uncharacterized membrane protein